MEVLFMLIAFSVLIAVVFLAYFVWAVRNGQYDDNYTPAVRMLFDDDKPGGAGTEKGSGRLQEF